MLRCRSHWGGRAHCLRSLGGDPDGSGLVSMASTSPETITETNGWLVPDNVARWEGWTGAWPMPQDQGSVLLKWPVSVPTRILKGLPIWLHPWYWSLWTLVAQCFVRAACHFPYSFIFFCLPGKPLFFCKNQTQIERIREDLTFHSILTTFLKGFFFHFFLCVLWPFN